VEVHFNTVEVEVAQAPLVATVLRALQVPAAPAQ
jgi:hypothetical protein